MNILICIDDTDDLESRGTGELASLIAEGIEQSKWGSCSVVTRHQLLIHEDIPYTSHNSSMCFQAELADSCSQQQVIEYASNFLKAESAEGSDPGLAVVAINSLTATEKVVKFGQRAKREVLTKEEAYAFAKEQYIHLSEHGGTGQGVIGALAGIGLRLSGNDGRIKGKLKLGKPGARIPAKELLLNPHIDAIQTLEGVAVPEDQSVQLGEKVKTVWLNHQTVLLVFLADDGRLKTCGKQQLRNY